MQQDLEICM